MRALLRLCGGPLAALGGALLVSLPARSAQAFEDLVSLDLGVGYGLVSDAPHLSHAGGLDLGVGYGIHHAWSVRGALGGQMLGGRHGARAAGRLLAEVSYAFDVLRVVPAVGLGASAALVARPDDRPGQAPGAAGGPHLLLSLDYLWTRSLNVGLDLRELVYFGLGTPSFVSEARARVSWLFEAF